MPRITGRCMCVVPGAFRALDAWFAAALAACGPLLLPQMASRRTKQLKSMCKSLPKARMHHVAVSDRLGHDAEDQGLSPATMPP